MSGNPLFARQALQRAASLPLVILALFTWFLVPGRLQAQSVPRTWHVSTSGSDTNPGTPSAPLRTVQKAISVVRPGDTILVHAGTYVGPFDITRSGKPGQPITLRSADAGAATLTAALPRESCSRTGPTFKRTIRVKRGSDYWTIQDFVVVGGILLTGTNLNLLTPHVWDRTLPGRGLYDPEAASRTLESLGSDGADHIHIVNNTIRGRGVLAAAARDGILESNRIEDIACGTGGGVWLGLFSDGWTVRLNHVLDIVDSGGNHWMTEGIRMGSASMYNTVAGNVLERLWGEGRGVATDASSGWNVIRSNRVSQADIGFSEQHGGWGNRWIRNVAERNRRYGFRVGPGLTRSDDHMPLYIGMECNQSVDDALGLSIGSAGQSVFSSNDFSTVIVYSGFQDYWPKTGNRWNGASSLPAERQSSASFYNNCS